MVKIITDTTSGLPAETASRYDIPVTETSDADPGTLSRPD